MALSSHRPAKGRISPLPSYSSAVSEKAYINNGRVPASGLFTVFHPSIPGVPGRRLNLPVPVPPRVYNAAVNRFGRKRGCMVIVLGIVTCLWTVFALAKRFGSQEKQWPTILPNDSTLVFQREDLRKIWEWEIASGHYPSSRKSALSIFIQYP